MTRTILTALLGVSLMGVPALVGCDRTIEEKHTVEQKKDGTTVKTDKEVKQTPDGGTIEKKKEEVTK